MNKILSTFALFFALATLSGCERGEIEYAGTTCEVPDSSRVTYNTELAEAYKTIDSATADMLKSRGPKGSRHENEDIDDEYEGALDVANRAKETRKEVLNDKYCIVVDEYRYVQSGVAYFVNEFQIKTEDTAVYHEIKRNSLYGK